MTFSYVELTLLTIDSQFALTLVLCRTDFTYNSLFALTLVPTHLDY